MALSASCVLEVQTSGSDNNGGLFDAGGSSPGTDYTYGAGQATFTYTDLVIGATTTQLTSVARPFVSADNRNGLQITSGSGFTLGIYEMVSESVISTVPTAAMDRSVGTAASINGNGVLGGPLLTFGKAIAQMTVTGIICWAKSGTYSISTGITFPGNGLGYTAINKVEGYTVTRGDRSTKPIIQATAAITMFTTGTYGYWLVNLEIDGNSTANNGFLDTGGTSYCGIAECKVRRMLNYGIKSSGEFNVFRNEVTACGGATDGAAVVTGMTLNYGKVHYNNIHDNTTVGIKSSSSFGTSIIGNLITNNSGASSDGIQVPYDCQIIGNTIYNNGRDGIRLTNNYPSIQGTIVNNVLDSNGQSSGTGYGINMTSAPTNSNAIPNCNYNAFYNNKTGARNNMPVGLNDVTYTADPFTAKGSNDYSLNATAGGGASLRGTGYPGVFPGGSSTGYLDIGAVQHADPVAVTNVIIRRQSIQ